MSMREAIERFAISVPLSGTGCSAIKDVEVCDDGIRVTGNVLMPKDRKTLDRIETTVFIIGFVVAIVVLAIYRSFLIEVGEADGVRNVLFENIMPVIAAAFVFWAITASATSLARYKLPKGDHLSFILPLDRIKFIEAKKGQSEFSINIQLASDKESPVHSSLTLNTAQSNTEEVEILTRFRDQVEALRSES